VHDERNGTVTLRADVRVWCRPRCRPQFEKSAISRAVRVQAGPLRPAYPSRLRVDRQVTPAVSALKARAVQTPVQTSGITERGNSCEAAELWLKFSACSRC
jgi:hypothetical protein